MSDLERELESELHRLLDPMSSMPIPARRAVASRGRVKTILGGAGAALTIKVLSGVAVAAAAVTLAGAATTHSLNPSVWGQQVKQQVDNCKDVLSQGDHGIGDCVSDFSSQHGATVASDARHHGEGAADGAGKDKDKNGNGNGNANGNGKSDNGKDKPKDTAPPIVDPMEPSDPSSHGQPKVTPKP